MRPTVQSSVRGHRSRRGAYCGHRRCATCRPKQAKRSSDEGNSAMITQHTLQNTVVPGTRGPRTIPVQLTRARRARASRYALIGLAILLELVVAPALLGATWSSRSIAVGTGNYTRQGPLPPPAPNAGRAAWQRYEQSLVSTGAAASPATQSARITSQASAASTPDAVTTHALPIPAPAPTPTRFARPVRTSSR